MVAFDTNESTMPHSTEYHDDDGIICAKVAFFRDWSMRGLNMLDVGLGGPLKL